MDEEASDAQSLRGQSVVEVRHLLPRHRRHIGAGRPSAVGNTGEVNIEDRLLSLGES